MERYLGRFEPQVYAILRIVVGFLFLWHGSQKMLGFPPSPPAPPSATPPPPPDPIMAVLGPMSGVIELVCGVLIMIGLLGGFAAFLSSGTMAVAYFIAHFKLQQFLPIQNRGELAVVYCFVFLYIAVRGSGIWSVDSLLFGSKSEYRRADE